MPTGARRRLLETAEELFYAEGIRAVGLERLLTVSGVGRASFYRHFASKDDLVVEVLRSRDERWRAGVRDAVAARGGEPLAIFDVLAERYAREDFRGCAFINAMAEAADPGGVVHQLADEHKRAVAEYVAELLSGFGHPEPRALADEFVLLIDGANVTALRERSPEPALRAKAIAAALLDAREPTADVGSSTQRTGLPRPSR